MSAPRISIALALAFALAFAGACEQLAGRLDPSSGGVVTKGELGEFIRVGELEVQVHSLEDPYVPSEARAAEQIPAGMRLVAADVELRHAGGGGSQSYNATKWYLYTSEGHAATGSALGPTTKAPKLVEGALSPGNKARGWVTFELAEGASLDRIEYLSGHLSGDMATIRLAK